MKEVTLKILNNGRVYITQSVITRVFPRGPRQLRYNEVAVYPHLVTEPARGQIVVPTAEQAEEATYPTATKVEEDELR